MRSTRSPSRRRAASTAFCAVLTALLVVACGGGDAPDKATASFGDGRAKPLALMAGMHEAPAAPPSPEAPPPASEAEAAAQATSGAGALPAPAGSQSAAAESGICPSGTSYFTSHATLSHYFAEDGTLMVQEQATPRSEYCGVTTGSTPLASDVFAAGTCGNIKLSYKSDGVNAAGQPKWKVANHVNKCKCLCTKTADKGDCESRCIALWGEAEFGHAGSVSDSSWQSVVNGVGNQSKVSICQSSCEFSSFAADGQVNLPLKNSCMASCNKSSPHYGGGTLAGAIIAKWFDNTADPVTGKPKP